MKVLVTLLLVTVVVSCFRAVSSAPQMDMFASNEVVNLHEIQKREVPFISDLIAMFLPKPKPVDTGDKISVVNNADVKNTDTSNQTKRK